jgi:hypothetical protein
MINNKKKHHYISQVEQKLNAIDPTVKKRSRRIYSFDITDRESYEIAINNVDGVKIEPNLKELDLFTFDTIDEDNRINLENLFTEYESIIEDQTVSLLDKAFNKNADILFELQHIFTLKLLNVFRNPYCIKYSINTLNYLLKYIPTEEIDKEYWNKIDTGVQPHLIDITIKYGISEAEYHTWLKLLFIILKIKFTDSANLLDMFIKQLFEDKNKVLQIELFKYEGNHSNKFVLLSDRNFINYSNNEFDCSFFNLNANSFVMYKFIDQRNYLQKKGYSIDSINNKIRLDNKMKPTINVKTRVNNLEMLAAYNKSVITQSVAKVFNKGAIVYGI